ncbi:MAG: DUF72 domain-containing protein [Deltaproteobacteria bacterium]|nr:DUF72 domain-containing protein [Deltaproteobacteria bacterium]
MFYPQSKGKRFDELRYYCQFFDAVEVNTTFYRPPVADMARAWVRKTPSDFEFSIKVWQKFTHARQIGHEVERGEELWSPPTQEDVELFLAGLEPLADSRKLGVLLFQYPPGFHLTPENADKLVWTLKAFRNYPKAVELRHRSWSDRSSETKEILGEFRTSWVLIDEPKFASSVRQDFESAGEILYFRAHGRNSKNWWNPAETWMRYDYCYTLEEIREFAKELRRVIGERPDLQKSFVFFNNHAKGQAAVNAIMLNHEMGFPIKATPIDNLLRSFPQLSRTVLRPAQGRLL